MCVIFAEKKLLLLVCVYFNCLNYKFVFLSTNHAFMLVYIPISHIITIHIRNFKSIMEELSFVLFFVVVVSGTVCLWVRELAHDRL